MDEEGREYFANSDLGISSWSDPRHATQQLGEENIAGCGFWGIFVPEFSGNQFFLE